MKDRWSRILFLYVWSSLCWGIMIWGWYIFLLFSSLSIFDASNIVEVSGFYISGHIHFCFFFVELYKRGMLTNDIHLNWILWGTLA